MKVIRISKATKLSGYSFLYKKTVKDLITENHIPLEFTGTIEIETGYTDFDLVHMVNGMIASDNGPAIEMPRCNQKFYFINGEKTTFKAWKELKKQKGTTLGFTTMADPYFSMIAIQQNYGGVIISFGPLKWQLDSNKLYWIANEETKEFWGIEKCELLTAQQTRVFNFKSDTYIKSEQYKKQYRSDLNLVLLDQLSQVKNQSQGKP